MQVKNKIAVITGASDGLGKHVALALAKEGVLLALVARDSKKLKTVIKEVEKLGSPKAFFYTCDVRHLDQIKNTVSKIMADFGKVDILINSAGIWQKLNALENISEETVDEVIQINLTGMIHFTRLVLP